MMYNKMIELKEEPMMNLSGGDAILDLSKNNSILDLSKTAKPKPPIREKFPQFSPNFNDILAANAFWRVPPFQNHFVLNLSHVAGAAKPEPNDTTCDSSYSSSNNSTESTECSDTIRSRTNKRCVKDDTYYERRRKNNLAAKKSRDAKRRRENEIRERVIVLEAENKRLRQQLSTCSCGEEGEYMDNDVAPAQRKVNQYPKEKRQEEAVNVGESVVVHPK